jgi:hypothetical protein
MTHDEEVEPPFQSHKHFQIFKIVNLSKKELRTAAAREKGSQRFGPSHLLIITAHSKASKHTTEAPERSVGRPSS